MIVNPVLGIFFHALGGFSAGSFYIPFKRVRNWAWEVYWLVGGVFAWLVAPIFVSFLAVPDSIVARNLNNTLFSETEAAEQLGISVSQLRDLIRNHILKDESELENSSKTTFQPSDLVMLRLLGRRSSPSTVPG